MAINKYDEAIRTLAAGYADQFAEQIAGDERIHDIIMELASEFVEKEIPVVSEDSQTDLAIELLMSVSVRTVS